MVHPAITFYLAWGAHGDQGKINGTFKFIVSLFHYVIKLQTILVLSYIYCYIYIYDVSDVHTHHNFQQLLIVYAKRTSHSANDVCFLRQCNVSL